MGILSAERLIVGYDLRDEGSQISFAASEDVEAQTLSQVAGAQVYNIPTVLRKRKGTNQWLYGREALRCGDDEGVLVERLLSLALDGEQVTIEGESYDPVSLLTLFFKKTLGLLASTGQKMTALMITCDTLDRRAQDVIPRMVQGAKVKADRIAAQSHEESFYSYMLRQPGELWNHDAILFDYHRGGVKALRMETNRRTTPIVVYAEEKRYAFPGDALPIPGKETEGRELSDRRKQELDEAFLQIAQDFCGERKESSVFLIGDGFAGEWMKESIRFLCSGRRVFQGNNLFSKGACCGMQEKILPSSAGKSYVFLGKDKLKSNIGMRLFRQGEETYCALLDAGANWYEAEHTMELYLQEGKELVFTITPLTESVSSGRSRLVSIVLEGLPEGTAKLRVHLFLEDGNRLVVEVQDLGFGALRASSGRVWREEIGL